jgi:hypothetical protein
MQVAGLKRCQDFITFDWRPVSYGKAFDTVSRLRGGQLSSRVPFAAGPQIFLLSSTKTKGALRFFLVQSVPRTYFAVKKT